MISFMINQTAALDENYQKKTLDLKKHHQDLMKAAEENHIQELRVQEDKYRKEIFKKD